MIDWNHINQLRQDLGAEGFAEIVDLFHAEVAEVFERLKKQPPSPSDMHFLKSSAANLGFIEFSKTCQIAEHTLREEGGSVDVQGLISSFESAQSHFAKGLANHPI